MFILFKKIYFFIDNKAVGIMKAGNSFTIEPMISEGTWRDEQWVNGLFKFFLIIFWF